jgi:hypothetical protein
MINFELSLIYYVHSNRIPAAVANSCLPNKYRCEYLWRTLANADLHIGRGLDLQYPWGLHTRWGAAGLILRAHAHTYRP